jgi:hypothetical protein
MNKKIEIEKSFQFSLIISKAITYYYHNELWY